MAQKIYQVDAFTDQVFGGNPAAVCPLDEWLPDALMLKIANENNLSETAFYVKQGDEYHIRWFTPEVEIDLCGHATLAAAYVLFNHENHEGDQIRFYSHLSGPLAVRKDGERLTLDFPTDEYKEVPLHTFEGCFDKAPQEAYKGKNKYMLVFRQERDITDIIPNYGAIGALGLTGVIITAPGEKVDFVSRFFAPQSGINEDPVTGSAHTFLTPYWAARLDKKDLSALQLSARVGSLQCKDSGDRVEISGYGKLYMIGEIYLD